MWWCGYGGQNKYFDSGGPEQDPAKNVIRDSKEPPLQNVKQSDKPLGSEEVVDSR